MISTASAASGVGTVTRTISQPACSKRRICSMVAPASSVFVLHIDWMVTGAPPPTATPPTMICFVMLLPSQQQAATESMLFLIFSS